MSRTDAATRRQPRRRIVLAALAFLGIGAALTTAAWTDQVWFSAGADAASYNLLGSTSPADGWGEYATEEGALQIPVELSGFGDIVPNTGPITTKVYVKNDSTADTTIALDTKTTGTLFAADSTVSVSAAADTLTLGPGEYTSIDITLAAGEIPAAYQGATGAVTLNVTGSTN